MRKKCLRVLLSKAGRSPREFKAFEAVAEVGGADGLGMVGREADVPDRQLLAGDPVLLQGQPRLGRAPA